MKSRRYAIGRRAFVAAICTLTLVSLPLPGATGTTTATPPAIERLLNIISADRSSSRVQSVLFGAWVGERPLLVTAAGDSIGGVRADVAMHIRPGIVETEALTTILVQLADRKGGLLDAPLATWFPTLPRAKKVTLRMLGNNRSGYGDYLADASFQKRLNENPFQTFSASELISIGMKQPMSPEPGKSFHYSHTNAVLLGEALQANTGKTVAALVRERVTERLRLGETEIPASADVPHPAQHLFYRDRGPYEDSTYWNPSWASHSGAIVSTIRDVAVMQRAFGSGALVSKKGLATILAPTNASAPPQTRNFYYGLGVIVGNTWILQHAQVAGSDVVMGYLPSRDLTIVVSTAIGYESVPRPRGYSTLFFNDAAAVLAPERRIPAMFL